MPKVASESTKSQGMNRITLSYIFLLSLINIFQCKKYLVEVEDKNGDNAKNQESNEETLEDNTTTESEGKYTFPQCALYDN